MTQCGRSRDGILHRFTLNAKAELIDRASYASGQLMRDLVGRCVVLQAAGAAQKGAATRRLAPQPAVPHRRERFAHAGATGEPMAFTCLQAALRGRVRAMCSITRAPILMNLSRMVAKSALLRDWCLEWCRAQNAIQ